MSTLTFTEAPNPRRRLVRGAIVGVLVVAVAGVVTFSVAQADDNSGYRTAVVGPHEVTATIDAVGVVEPASQATVAFPIAGTVSTVDVKAGDTVTAGQQLATLDAAALLQAVRTEQAALDQAELALEKATESTAASDSAAPSGDENQPTGDIETAKQAVLVAQQDVDQKLQTAHVALDASTTTCTAVAEDTAACQTALASALTAQQSAADAQHALSDAAMAYDALVEQRASSGNDNATVQPGGGGGGGGDATSGQEASSEDLIALQKQVDAAQVSLEAALKAVQQATITSPIAGTVIAVDLAAGDAVDAASSTARITVEADAGIEVTVDVSVDQLPKIETGQTAIIDPDGEGKTVEGSVVAIGEVASSSTSGTNYPVTIGVPADTTLGNGSTASVSIVTGRVDAPLAVPTSAVHAENGSYSVTVLEGGKTRRVAVEVGTIGSTWTEITSGLETGQEVVLADIGAALPNSATSGGGQNELQLPGGGEFRGPIQISR